MAANFLATEALTDMETSTSVARNTSSIESELYFLIERFLSAGPCKDAARVLRRELSDFGLLPKRVDLQGREHDRSFDSLLELNRHIGCNHLLKICQRLGPLLDETVRPSVMGVGSLLGAGSQSLLRTAEQMRRQHWLPETHFALQHGRPLLPPINLVHPHWLHVHRGKEASGQAVFRHVLPISMYENMKLHSRKLGHLSAVYCVLYDRTGEVIFTGADDQLVKVWQASDGRLKATLRGHSAEITDLDVNYENTMLASGSCDKVIRVWCIRTKAPVVILMGHTGMITSLQFSPFVRGDLRYLASTGADGNVCFWEWNVATNKFNPKPIKYVERSRAGAQMLCSSFSPGGVFYAAGSTDHVIRMYNIPSGLPEKIAELEKHNDRVDSMCYSHTTNRFLSGSRDGVARIWRFERSEWRSIPLKMNEEFKSTSKEGNEDRKTDLDREAEEKAKPKLKVTMVTWNIDDSLIITAINDYSLKVWCGFTGKLKHILMAHEDEVFVLEASPIDKRIMLSAGHDGNTFIWDIVQGVKIKSFFNMIEGQGHGAVFDCKFSPDGTSFAATDSHGHLMIYGFGSNEKHKKIPQAVFFHTDYRPLVRDANGYVLDEQTQQAPHLMPPPFLVDIDGNPYPPSVQKLVPGREHLKDEHLVPQLAVNEEGEQEVLGDQVPEPPAAPVVAAPVVAQDGENNVIHRPSIDHMIEQLQREQDQRMVASGEVPIRSPPPVLGSPRGVSRSNSVVGGAHMVGMRRVGETEGVRQSLGNMQQPVSTLKDLVALSRRIVVKQIDPAVLRKSESDRLALADLEIRHYNIERRNRQVVLPSSSDEEEMDTGVQTRKKKKKAKHGYATRGGADNEDMATNRLTTRALYDTDEEEVDEDQDSDDLLDDGALAENGDSSDYYSDWMGDTAANLSPPKRRSKRERKKRKFTTSEDEDTEIDVVLSSPEGSQSRGKAAGKKNKLLDKKKRKKPRRKLVVPQMTDEEVKRKLETHRPPDWLTDTVPRKTPYFPQMGDEVIYFRQGHELYVRAVERDKAYPIDHKRNQPWHKNPSLREQELVRVIGLRIELLNCGVRLCCLKLAYIDAVTGKPNGGSFSVKYHDKANVIDFMVLRQHYDIAMNRKWKPGDRFRSLIEDSWWIGIIEAHIPFQEEFPDSLFQCFKVRWDNSDREFLSPWDLEPIDENRVTPSEDRMHGRIRYFVESCARLFNHTRRRAPSVLGGGVHVTSQELQSLLYVPKSSDWPDEGRDQECDRLARGWEEIMQHSIAEPFLTPVDLNVFPSYSWTVEYPIDLSTMKRRLENRFYRRITSVQFDIRYLEVNANKFNEPRSQICKSAKIITDALLNFVSDVTCESPVPLINRLSDGQQFQWSTSSSSDSGETTEDYESHGAKRRKGEGKGRAKKKRRLAGPKLDPDGWKIECRSLLDTIAQCEDSAPFRQPVDINVYPNYYEVIEHPMDLGNVRQNLANGAYNDPTEFTKDMRLMFSNSKSFNTNKRSRIYAMTLRLSAMFAERIKDVLTSWKRAMKQNRKRYKNGISNKVSSSGIRSGSSRQYDSPRKYKSGITNGRIHSSDEDSDLDFSPGPSRSIYSRNRPQRERRAARRISGYSDPEEENFPEPKPDYSDDDFELRPRCSPKKSPQKKKKRGEKSRKRRSRITNGESTSRYSTRTRTGTVKPRYYNNDCVFSDLDDMEEEVVHKSRRGRKGRRKKCVHNKRQVEDSGSDTEIDTVGASNAYPRRSKAPVHKSQSPAHRKTESSDSETDEEPRNTYLTRTSSRRKPVETYDSGSDTEDTSAVTPIRTSQRPRISLKLNLNQNNLQSSRVTLPSSSSSSSSSSESDSESGSGWSSETVVSESTSAHPNLRQTRNQGKRTVPYKESSEDNSSNSANVGQSVSSRGRVRKATAKARALLD